MAHHVLSCVFDLCRYSDFPVKQIAESSPERLNCSLLRLLYSFPNTRSCKNRTPLNKKVKSLKKTLFDKLHAVTIETATSHH